MSFFSNFFNSSESESNSKIKWRLLSDLGQLNELIDLSHQQPIIIFKHSTRCSISRFVLKSIEKDYDFSEEELLPYFLDLLSYRNISIEIANRFEIMHQSPQILLIKDGVCVFNSSHENIQLESLRKYL